jgi:hypothetical protein
LAHVLVGEPVSTSPEHALARRLADAGRWAAPGHSARCHFAWLRRRDETFTLRLLARQLARAANGLASLPRGSLRRLFVEAPSLHLAENAFPLHLLLENAKRLVDVVVTNEYLQDLFLSCHGPPRGLPAWSTIFGVDASRSGTNAVALQRNARIRSQGSVAAAIRRAERHRAAGDEHGRFPWRCGGSTTGLSAIGALSACR